MNMLQRAWTMLIILFAAGALVLMLLVSVIMNQDRALVMVRPTAQPCQGQNIQQLASLILNKIDSKSVGNKPDIHIHVSNWYGAGGAGAQAQNANQHPIPTQVPIFPQGQYSARVEPNNTIFKEFRPSFNALQYNTLMASLVKLAHLCTRFNITYMLYSGTLLGSYRHHDLIPWDDDLDVFMPYSQKSQIVNVLMKAAPDYHIHLAGARMKFYSTYAEKTSKYSWKWPYIDISFYKENDTHIWDGSMEDDYGDRAYCWPKTGVFPLHKRPLGAYFFDSPKDAYMNLILTYRTGLNVCYTAHYTHRLEKLKKVDSLSCESLSQYVPFVHRSPSNSGVLETLMIGKKIIHSITVPEPEYAVTKPYAIELL